MKKNLLLSLTLLAVAFMTTAAMADVLVRYNTSVQGGACPQTAAVFCAYHAATNTTTLTATDASDGDTVVLTYFGVGNASTPSYADALIGPSGVGGAQLGQFSISSNHVGGPGLSTASALLNGDFFNISISQILPSAGGGTLVADLNGTLSVAPDGTITFTLAHDHAQIGIVTYRTERDSFGLNNSSGQITSIDGTVSTPEPASLALFGSGLLGIAGTIRRKLKA
jgi:hypothetical protein